MKNVIEKLKPVFLLLGLTVLCIGIVWVTRQFKDVFASQLDYGIAQQVPVSIETISKENNTTDTSQPSKVEKDSEGYVYAASTSSDSMCPSSTINISSQSVCSKDSSGEVDFSKGTRSGDVVSKSSKVILSQVTVPLELFSGMEVKDSNRLITSKTPTFKAAGEQMDETLVNTQLPPGTQISEYNSWTADKPFTTDYKLGFSSKSDEPTNEGEIGVDKKLLNECEECNNKANINPDKSNKMSEVMLDKTYRTPGEKAKVKEADVIESCSKNNSTFIPWNSEFEGCYLSIVERLVALFQTIGDGLWGKCTSDPPSEDCVYVEDIVIIMASPFGSENDCIDSTCTNAYMNIRNKSALEPSASGSNKTYYTTECKAFIERKERNILCAWDMSHLFKERKVSELDDIPTLDSTPSDGAYKQFLQNQVNGKRGSASDAIQLQ